MDVLMTLIGIILAIMICITAIGFGVACYTLIKEMILDCKIERNIIKFIESRQLKEFKDKNE